ncbi:alpha/beta fold hydrolase [Sphingobium aquiterrae]|uniref:alpha/beta fold hydrolase n=1 Tax=Sphingobium aquiterrae TaxID=2038656 RepID=UPI003016FCA5
MATYVLVHGAWHGAWAWERIVPLLEAAGHRVIAPDLKGMGADDTPLEHVSLALWADQVADILRAQAEPVILAGHSRGGIVISEAAERVPEKVATLVYVAAFLIPDGGTLLEVSHSDPPRATGKMLKSGPHNSTTLVPQAAADVIYSATPPQWRDRAVARLCAEPMDVFATPLTLSEARFGTVPRAYVECTGDLTVPLPLQRAMQAALPCVPLFTLESDHSPAVSQPDALARCLLTLAP